MTGILRALCVWNSLLNLPSRQFQPKRCDPSLLGASQYEAMPRGFVSLALARFTLVEVSLGYASN